jgi:ribosome biogenesis protein
LRASIDEYLTANGVSAETTLSVEYVRARIPPVFVASFEHDDWVSSVHALSASTESGPEGRILSASFDGYLRVWNSSSRVIATSPQHSEGGHAASVKSARFVSASQIASSGSDRTVRLWKYMEDEGGFSASITPQLELYGHKSSVDSVRVHHQSNRILSASSDHTVGFWSTKKGDAPPAPESLLPSALGKSNKRRRLNPSVSVPQRGPLAVFKQHTGPVSGAIFDSNDATVGYSASWDHSVRTWDLVTSALVDTRTTSHALFAVEQMPDLHLVAAGSAGRDVKLIDVRDSATTVSAITLKGHKNSVVALARDPDSEYTLVSGSHDGTCRVWDVRSRKNSKDGVVGQSLYTIGRESLGGKPLPIAGEGVQVYGVCWDKDLGILSGGQDKRVQINRGDGVAT